jgi:SAM-dependent methyltransferase
MDPRLPAKHLLRGEDGVWYACEREAISYSEEGNAKCFELEEGSFWFAHRGACLQATVRRLPPSGAIYDIGGGNGFVTKTLIDAGFETVLVEPGETGARNAVRRGVPTVICATLATAGFRDGSLPAAGLFDVLEHIEDDAGFLAEVHRCLEPGGRLYLTVPAFSWLWSHDDVVAGHFRRYTLGSVAARMEAAGFAPLYATYLFSLLPLPLLVMRGAPSFFGRRALPPQSYGKLHQARARGFTDRVWAAELRRVENGQVIPFGSSCLLVMQKR